MVLVINKFIACSGKTRSRNYSINHHVKLPDDIDPNILYPYCVDKSIAKTTLMLAFLIIEGLLFGLFTFCMLVDQIQVVTSGLTQIDKLKGEYKSKRREYFRSTKFQKFALVFGGDKLNISYKWLLPLSIIYENRDKIYGYKLKQTKNLELIV